MKIDLTSMFFNSKIEGQTATAAWGTSVSKQTAPCLIYENEDFNNIFSGMLFCSKTDVENLDIKGMSSSRELIMFSIFNKIFVIDKRNDYSDHKPQKGTYALNNKTLITAADYCGRKYYYRAVQRRAKTKNYKELVGFAYIIGYG